MKYCVECGTKLIEQELKNEGLVPYCTSCKQYRFPIYNTAVSMIVINKENDKVLLIQQYGRPYNILVAGYVNKGEGLEEAVVREVKEETGLDAESIHFNRSHFYEPSNTLMCNFTVYVENDRSLKTNEEIDSYHWFTKTQALESIKPNSLASYFLHQFLEK